MTTSLPAQVPLSEGFGPRCRSETGDVMLCTNAACGWVGRCVVAEPMEAGEERDCRHGELARACDRCADAREIAELRAANDRFGARQAWWTERMFALEQERDALKSALAGLVQVYVIDGAATTPASEIGNAWKAAQRALLRA